MDKKTIWVINQTAGKPDSGWGERHYFLAKYWIKKGYKVVIISGSYNHLFINQPKVSHQTCTIEKVEEGITFCWVKTPVYFDGGFRKFWSNLLFMLRLFLLPHKKLGKPTIIIVSSMPIFPIVNGYLFKKRFQASKLIVEIRDLWPLTPIHLKGYSKNHPLVKIVAWFEKFAYKKADDIVSVLSNSQAYIDNISGNPSKFKWIPNGIDENLLKKEGLPNETVAKIPVGKFIIAYTGTMGMANALEYLIEAAILLKENPSIHIVLVGNGYLKDAIKEQVKGNSNITFIDKINKDQVQTFLSYVDVCFIGRNNTPLFDYGVSSNKYFDYMLASKPILESSNEIKSPAQLSNCGITVKPESAEAIVEGILALQATAAPILKKIGENGYHYVLKYHNFEYLSEKYSKLF